MDESESRSKIIIDIHGVVTQNDARGCDETTTWKEKDGKKRYK